MRGLGFKKKQILAISNFDWNKAFENLSVEHFSKITLQIKKNKCDYWQPPSIKDNIKRSLKEKSKLAKHFYKSGQRKIDHDNV